MPSFDIVNRLNQQELENALNNTRREIQTRYDFRRSRTEIVHDVKEKAIKFSTEDEMKMKAVLDIFAVHCSRRSISQKGFDYGPMEATSNGTVKRQAKIIEGIEAEAARRIVKKIKEMKLKVQPAIQDVEVRVTGKKIDDLQAVIAMLKSSETEVPLQFVNFL